MIARPRRLPCEQRLTRLSCDSMDWHSVSYRAKVFSMLLETLANEKLPQEASNRPETRLGFLGRTCSVAFVLHFACSTDGNISKELFI